MRLAISIDDAYILEEWHSDGLVFRRPQVEGRIIFLKGEVLTILINKTLEEKRFTITAFGVYKLNADVFSYRYDNASMFTQTQSAINVSHNLPWVGMRDFDITQEEGATVRLRSRSSEQAEFVFSAEGLRYSENGKLLRVWRRSRSE
jgi:hypothetical protein